MLDLSILKEKVFDLVLPDGEVVHVLKPNKILLVEVERLAHKLDNIKLLSEVQEELERITMLIMSRNKEGILFNTKKLDELGIDMTLQGLIFREYFKFVVEVMRNPN